MPATPQLEPVAKPPLEPRAPLPEWHPAWARELADLYYSGATSTFVLWGNVHDLIRTADGAGAGGADGGDRYVSLEDFLAAQVFGRWDLVIGYDLGRGLRAEAGGDAERFRKMALLLNSAWSEPDVWPRECDKVLPWLDASIERNLLAAPADRKSIALVFDYAQFILPNADLDSLARGNATRLVRFLNWAENPQIRRVNMAIVLVADKLGEVNDRLVQSPHVAAIEIPLPEKAERERYVQFAAKQQDVSRLLDLGAAAKSSVSSAAAEVSSGLSLTSLNVVITQAVRSGKPVDLQKFRQIKKTMIERQCQGLVEFVQPKHSLDLLVGHAAAKQRLQEDAAWILRGQLDAAPMGYLISGPVGTGKTFLAECYAGSIGIPCAMLRNFRSKYVGETEGNLQQVLTVLRSLGPVVVVVDEADAALGNRQAEGDSGTSARVFSMIASQMGDTDYRGMIVWMLLTSRPDLLPIDLKRQGRAEVHIPLFYPHDAGEVRQMFAAMARKNKLTLADDAIPTLNTEGRLSGADIESIVLAVKRQALTAGKERIEQADVQRAVDEFIPSAQGLEKELQEIASVLECTQTSFLPPQWRDQVAAPNGRSRLQERVAAIRQLLEA